MKKISLTLIAALAITFASCGSKTTEKAEESTETTTEQTEAPVANADAKSVVDQYADLLEKYIPLVEKVKAGDAAASQEMAQIAEEIGKLVTENQEAFTNLSEEDLKKYQELAERFMKAMQ